VHSVSLTLSLADRGLIHFTFGGLTVGFTLVTLVGDAVAFIVDERI